MDQELKRILIDLLQSMKLRTGAVFELSADVEGLKAVVSFGDRPIFADTSQRVRGEARIAFEGEIHSLDEAIEQLRRMP
ncbi:MAG TPA: hypothetical protein VNX18_07545 [Bryobacteraceae bacterium]|jgi:hypothetical protein|nr:hypothetical protein [Bryobacteraceae bacterium]